MMGSLAELVPRAMILLAPAALQALNGSQTDGAGAGNHNVVAELEGRIPNTMEGYADCVKQNGILGINALGHLYQHGVLHITNQHILGIAAVGAADTGCAGEAVDADVGFAPDGRRGAVLGAVGRRAAESYRQP